jgi:hypothetical protein
MFRPRRYDHFPFFQRPGFFNPSHVRANLLKQNLRILRVMEYEAPTTAHWTI